MAEDKTPQNIPMGWQCPFCGRIHAPWVNACNCRSNPPMPTAPWKEVPTSNPNVWKLPWNPTIPTPRYDPPTPAITGG